MSDYPVINLDDVNPQDEKNLLVFLEQVASGCTSGHASEWRQYRPAIRYVLARLTRYQTALEEISLGKGAFSRDPFEHCKNTVADMKRIAQTALEGEKKNG